MRIIFKLLGITTFLWALTVGSVAYADVTPTTQWVSFYSNNSKLEGKPLPVGAVVRAYDSAGNQCGEFVVHTVGSYGFLVCYFDDPNTPIDEGIRPGESAYFTVNGKYKAGSAFVGGSASSGERIRYDLDATLELHSCGDSYEGDDEMATAKVITGPEAHSFYSRKESWDQDWSKFTARSHYTYQIRARSFQSFDMTHPALRLYDANSTLLAENDLDKWNRGAEIWWWNPSDKDVMVYIQTYEKNGQFGCRHYTLTVIPWSPAEMALRFGQ